GLPHGSLFMHHWFVGTEDEVDQGEIMRQIDENLKVLNDDYIVERRHALKEVKLTKVPSALFYAWMKSEGKEGGQNKFPRVLKGDKMKSWLSFLQANHIEIV
ncbi:GH3 auxin-responsive promoter family protein, partial [Belliella pelovolcani]